MARKVLEVLVDDIDGKELKEGDGHTVTFSHQGVNYELDVSDKNAEKLSDALAPFVAAARRVGGRQSRGTSPTRIDKAQVQAMRIWAKENGHKVSDRGRVSGEIQDAYHAAH